MGYTWLALEHALGKISPGQMVDVQYSNVIVLKNCRKCMRKGRKEGRKEGNFCVLILMLACKPPPWPMVCNVSISHTLLGQSDSGEQTTSVTRRHSRVLRPLISEDICCPKFPGIFSSAYGIMRPGFTLVSCWSVFLFFPP